MGFDGIQCGKPTATDHPQYRLMKSGMPPVMGCKMNRKWFVTQIVDDEISTLTNKLIENSRNPAGPSSARKIMHVNILYRRLQKLHLPIKHIIIS